MRRYKNWAHKISSQKYLTNDLSCQCFLSTGWLISALHPELLSGDVENQQLQQHMISSLWRSMASPHGKCQFVVDKIKMECYLLRSCLAGARKLSLFRLSSFFCQWGRFGRCIMYKYNAWCGDRGN